MPREADITGTGSLKLYEALTCVEIPEQPLSKGHQQWHIVLIQWNRLQVIELILL